MRVAGAIIAGGRSNRMGGTDKLLTEIGGQLMIDRIIARLKPQADMLIINANSKWERFDHTGLAVIPDLLNHGGTPAAGLHAALVWAGARDFDRLLTVTADTPFLPDDLAARLSGANAAAAIAASGGQRHFLIGLWDTSLLPRLEQTLTMKNHVRVQDWVRMSKAVTVAWPTNPYDPFFNINTPEDLAEARRIAAEFDP